MRMRDTLAQFAAASAGAGSSRLTAFTPDGSNPGALAAYSYVPQDIPRGAPLVVVLHGCTQTAAGYDAGTGWSQLADRAGFALLFPEQRRANNANLCFNWFQGGDIVRAGGEAESVAQMVATMIDRHDLDPARVYVTGLSAGGAMTAVMLATYPDVFAGGAIIGGLPYNSAHGVGQALERMAGRGRAASTDASQASGATPVRWPSVSIWHGTADHTVVVGNMDDIATQWLDVHGVDSAAPQVDRGKTWERRRWSAGKRMVVETWRIDGMGHGVPIDPTGSEKLGAAGPYMLPVGIDSTAEIARSWGLIDTGATAAKVAPDHAPNHAPKPATGRTVVPADYRPASGPRSSSRPSNATPPPSSIQQVIENALRSAGLMK